MQKRWFIYGDERFSSQEELTSAKKAIDVLGGEIKHTHTFSLPQEDSERSIIIINKQRKTPKKYPRKAGTPNKSPIE